jgi:hypothetical protein
LQGRRHEQGGRVPNSSLDTGDWAATTPGRQVSLLVLGSVDAGKVNVIMAQLAIQFGNSGGNEVCGLCGRRVCAPPGPVLLRPADQAPVCRDCGKKHAPALVALLDLAHVAQRVGHVARHTLVPSLKDLLDLARAAENYNHTTSEPPRHVA